MPLGRYFLFNVPSELTALEVKHSLGDLIKYPEGILDLRWYKPGNEGTVTLTLDPKALQLIKNRRQFLYVNATPVDFVDKDELITNAWSTIDDDVLELVKEEVIKDGGKGAFDQMVSMLTLIKFQHSEGYDCWRVEGSFSEIKKFEVAVRRFLFKGVDSPSSSTAGGRKSKKKTATPKKRPSRAMRRIKQTGSTDEDEAIRSGDLTEDIEAGIQRLSTSPSVTWSADTTTSTGEVPVTMDKLIVASKGSLPLRFEFCVGNPIKERGVDAVVIPTNVFFEPNANVMCTVLRDKIGRHVYDAFRQETLTAYRGYVPDTTAVPMEVIAPCANKTVIFVVIPIVDEPESTENLLDQIAECYRSVLKVARMKRCLTMSLPPLGYDSGVDEVIVAAGAATALKEACDARGTSLADYVDIIRFMFPHDIIKKNFVGIFSAIFEPVKTEDGSEITKRLPSTPKVHKPQISAAVPLNTILPEDEMCRICRGSIDDGQPKKRLKRCGHEFHKQCIETWHLEKRTCALCMVDGDNTEVED